MPKTIHYSCSESLRITFSICLEYTKGKFVRLMPTRMLLLTKLLFYWQSNKNCVEPFLSVRKAWMGERTTAWIYECPVNLNCLIHRSGVQTKRFIKIMITHIVKSWEICSGMCVCHHILYVEIRKDILTTTSTIWVICFLAFNGQMLSECVCMCWQSFPFLDNSSVSIEKG